MTDSMPEPNATSAGRSDAERFGNILASSAPPTFATGHRH
jgi:hypothetical protein